jgi:hypothetical protein
LSELDREFGATLQKTQLLAPIGYWGRGEQGPGNHGRLSNSRTGGEEFSFKRLADSLNQLSRHHHGSRAATAES